MNLFRFVSAATKGFGNASTSFTFGNEGTVDWLSGTISNDPSFTLENRAGGLFDVLGSLTYMQGTFDNAGTLRKASAGNSAWNQVCFLESGGTIDLLNGGTITIDDTCP